MARDSIESLMRLKEIILSRLKEDFPEIDEDQRDRILWELAVVAMHEHASYILDIAEFSNELRKLKIPYLSGHPTGNSSILLYMLGITDEIGRAHV